jgi:hypothetical protein
MIDSALKFISDQAVKASGPHINTVPAEPPYVYFVNGERKIAEPAPRAHVAKDLSAIIAFAKASEEIQANTATVWYSADGVVCFIDDATRRDYIYLPLSFSPQLKEIIKWGDRSPPIKHHAFILLLRTMFKYCLTQAPNLIANLRVVKFASSSTTNSATGSSKVSIGKSIEAEVSNADGIPEEFFFNVPIFAEPLSKMEGLIDVALQCDAGSESFTLIPTPGAVAKQIALAENAIGATLREELGEGVVHYGSPAASFPWNGRPIQG